MNNSVINSFLQFFSVFDKLLAYTKPIANLALKCWVANVFFKSGLTKIESFDTTIMLFTDEYSVPLLSPIIAAYVGTIAELVLPVLLVIGLGGRMVPLGLFVFNIIAAISYPDLSSAGIQDHIIWGLMLFVLLANGPGRLSLDNLIIKKFLQQT
ncbi:DoxX family protein [Beggiatoa alba]|nr:DoxX family protein [Beggiatoa alba]